ncbi:zinc metalloprotease [Nocardioides aurantiacus]|uniref:Pregnancy-associated plasma protein-A n=1 Tax=Nocardioides aurantiacus TaxID=86796 RepID=A0A3N2CWQ8_9ACTN|nr:zinc metalloprotease [Nocardioides aurantiacus]ROR91985.1 pregnancy-associated plasma protein-A [Nocardioides aurantiacus]
MRPRRTLALVAAAALGLTTPTLPLAAHASATTDLSAVSGAGASAVSVVPCLTGAALRDQDVPVWRRGQLEDTPTITETDLRAVVPSETTRRSMRAEVEPVLPSRVTVPVYVHVIKGTHPRERNPFGPKRVAQALRILNNAFAGGQGAQNAPTRYTFELERTDYTKRDGWYHAYNNGPRDDRMKRALHRGGADALNLYLNRGGEDGLPVLGWARFPWRAAGTELDHVSINVDAMPGGLARGYNSGDTLVHEVGHWMGLFHTFQGGCEGSGDLVVDTAAEAQPEFDCTEGRDTCPDDPGLDPIHNFMDYSLDACMTEFTAGQVRRMDTAFAQYRSGRS